MSIQLKFNGVSSTVFDIEIIKGFISLKDLKYFAKPTKFQRDIDNEHVAGIKKFINNISNNLRIIPEIVITLPSSENFTDSEITINREIVKSYGGKFTQIHFKNLEKIEKNGYCEIVDGNHRTIALLQTLMADNEASGENNVVPVSFVNIHDDKESKAFFYYLNSKSKKLMSKDFFAFLETSDKTSLKNIDEELYYFKKTYDEIKKVINGKFKEEELVIRDGILKIAQEFAKSKHEQEYFDLILKGLIQTIPEIERIFKTANEFIIMLYIGMRIYLQEISNHKIQFKKLLEPINENEAIQTIIHSENENIQKSNTDIILITIEKIKKEIHGLKEWSYKAKIDFKNKDDENFEQIEFFYKMYNIYKNTYIPKRNKVFLSMPFDRETELTYFIILDVLHDLERNHNLKLIPVRVDKKIYPTSNYIPQRVYEEIENCGLMIADLTGNNRNVYNEIGYKTALDKDLIEPQIILIHNTDSYYDENAKKYKEKIEKEESTNCIANKIKKESYDLKCENKQEVKVFEVNIKELKEREVGFNINAISQIRFKDSCFLKTKLKEQLIEYYTNYTIEMKR
ncbi:ParB N-terminal domain-containing protein [Aliarcobacter butzleri]|uniref:hypothetical protein n=1 Tax=Aliarcobacter butzleri TaxID=28197 RepID=UPI00125EEC9A|nr:hypothetical protein [Aliarcobacter butzleri]